MAPIDPGNAPAAHEPQSPPPSDLAEGPASGPLPVALALGIAAILALVPLWAWTSLAGPGLAAAGTLYAACHLAVGRRLWRGPHSAAGGVLIAAAALMIPFVVHGLEHSIGFYPQTARPPTDLAEFLTAPAFLVDAAAIAALVVAVWRYPFAPLSALLVVAMWFLAMDAAPLAFGDATTWNQRALLSGILGAWAIAAGFLVDRRTRSDFAGWLYASGLFALCSALATTATTGVTVIVLYAGIGISLVVIGLILGRPIFAVFGALTIAGTAGRVAVRLLEGALLLWVAVGVAVAVFACGRAYGRIERRLAEPLRALLPPALRRVLPPPASN